MSDDTPTTPRPFRLLTFQPAPPRPAGATPDDDVLRELARRSPADYAAVVKIARGAMARRQRPKTRPVVERQPVDRRREPNRRTPAHEILDRVQHLNAVYLAGEDVRTRINRLVIDAGRDRARMIAVLETMAVRELDRWIAQYVQPIAHGDRQFQRRDTSSWCRTGTYLRLPLKTPASTWTAADTRAFLDACTAPLTSEPQDDTTFTREQHAGDVDIIATRGRQRTNVSIPQWFFDELSPDARLIFDAFPMADAQPDERQPYAR
jgi:hypothetical protein